MRVISTNRGFSLVELLTVIAIIAILAAIIFPVMSTVRGRANESNCLTNLQQIGQAVQMFKQDNRRYPDILGSEAVTMTDPPQKWTGSGSPDMFENAKDKYLFPEYTKSSIKVFHCPSSRITNSRDVVRAYKLPGDAASEVVIYAYDSYNSYVTGGVPPGGDPPFSLYTEGSTAEMHYRTGPRHLAMSPAAACCSRSLREKWMTAQRSSSRIMSASSGGETRLAIPSSHGAHTTRPGKATTLPGGAGRLRPCFSMAVWPRTRPTRWKSADGA